jgi:HlyD family secretion protein
MTTGTHSNRKRNVGLAIVLILVASTVAGYFIRRREIPLVVETEKVALRNLTEVVLANGKIQPVVQVTINPEVSGEIIALAVKEGQLVKAGDLLLKLKPCLLYTSDAADDIL